MDHPQFAKRLAGAHQRRVYSVGSPSLVRHFCLWHAYDGTDKKDLGENRYKIDDDYVSALYRALLAKSGSGVFKKPEASLVTIADSPDLVLTSRGERIMPLFDSLMNPDDGKFVDMPEGEEGEPPSIDPYRAVQFSVLWRGVFTTIHIESHTEYLSVTIILDFSRKGFDHLRTDSAQRWYDNLNAASEEHVGAGIDLKPICVFLYDDVWKQFDGDLLNDLNEEATLVGLRFVEFRIVVLRANALEPAGQLATRIARPEVGLDGQTSAPGPNTYIDKFLEIWRNVEGVDAPHSEFTLSTFFDHGAVFATTASIYSGRNAENANPYVRSMIYDATLNQSQLGRLIYRVNRAGTARIAATMHFEALNLAGKAIRRAELEIEDALWIGPALQNKPEHAKPKEDKKHSDVVEDGNGGKTARDVQPRDLRGAYHLTRDKIKAVLRIGRTFHPKTDLPEPDRENDVEWEPDDGEEKTFEAQRKKLRRTYGDVQSHMHEVSTAKFDGSLTYRVERSRYYASEFGRVASALRIRRVEGFQPYDEFVKQRLGQSFEYLDRLGVRYARAQNGLNTLLQMQRRLDSNLAERSIASAQEKADIALWSFLMPYYLGSTFYYYFKDSALSGLGAKKWVWPIFLMLSAALLVLTTRSIIFPKNREFWNRKNLVVAVYFWTITFILSLTLLFPAINKAFSSQSEKNSIQSKSEERISVPGRGPISVWDHGSSSLVADMKTSKAESPLQSNSLNQQRQSSQQ